MVNYNPNCTNKNCEGGVIVSMSGSHDRLCKFCNPSIRSMNKTPTITAEEYRGMIKKPARNKHGNVPTEVDGIKFQSTKEGQRWGILKLLEKRGDISELKRQQTWEFSVNNQLVCSYIADFEYRENGRLVVEDVKSEHTRKLPVYRIKKKLMAACYNIEIKET